MRDQLGLFALPAGLPDGFVYRAEFLTPPDEQSLLAEIATLPLEQARYRGFIARRRIASFGAGYDFGSNVLLPAPSRSMTGRRNSVCPAGQRCEWFSLDGIVTYRECIPDPPVGASCGGATAPQCDGACPAATPICADVGGTCQCTP